MTLLALWHVTYDGGDHDLTYTFREPYEGNIEVRAEDSSGAHLWPNYVKELLDGGVVHSITITPEPDWIYPVKIKIRGNRHGEQVQRQV